MVSYRRAITKNKFKLLKQGTFLRTIKKGYIEIHQLLKTEAIKSIITIKIVVKQSMYVFKMKD